MSMPLPADDFATSGPDAEAFHLSAAWFETWRRAYLVPGTATSKIGGLPMIADRGKLGPIGYARFRAQTNVHSALFDIPVGEPIADGLFDALRDGRDVVTIDYVTGQSRLMAAARGWPAHRVAIRPHARSPMADCRMSYQQWLALRSKRARQRWSGLERKATGEIGMTFELLDGHTGLQPLLDEIFAVEQSGWKGREGTSIRDNPSDLFFYTEIARRAAAMGMLRIAVLKRAGRIVAFEYGILGGDRLFLLKVGYDEQFADLSVGHVLAVMHIRHCCGDPAIAWYDNMGNGMTPAAYKLRFNDVVDTLYRITLYGDTWRGRLVQHYDAGRDRAKRARDHWRGRSVRTA
ncbi:MAG: GNAT family N-acetyltransferase [Pseudomonadota bacterium]